MAPKMLQSALQAVLFLTFLRLSDALSTVSSTSSSASPTASALTVGLYSYYGCQTEATAMRALASKSTAYDGMTLESCASDCAGYTYFGTEYGRECYCGQSFSAGSVPALESDCSFPCGGNSLEVCGAGSRLSVFEMPSGAISSSSPSAVSAPAIGSYAYYGCWTEATNARALSATMYASDAMTLEICAAFCTGYTYWGTEYARECYCGNSFSPGSIPAVAADCSFECMGNFSETCGAGSRLSVYSLVVNNNVASVTSSTSSSMIPSSTSSSTSSTPSSTTTSSIGLSTSSTSSSLNPSSTGLSTSSTSASSSSFSVMPSSLSSVSSLVSSSSSSTVKPTSSTTTKSSSSSSTVKSTSSTTKKSSSSSSTLKPTSSSSIKSTSSSSSIKPSSSSIKPSSSSSTVKPTSSSSTKSTSSSSSIKPSASFSSSTTPVISTTSSSSSASSSSSITSSSSVSSSSSKSSTISSTSSMPSSVPSGSTSASSSSSVAFSSSISSSTMPTSTTSVYSSSSKSSTTPALSSTSSSTPPATSTTLSSSTSSSTSFSPAAISSTTTSVQSAATLGIVQTIGPYTFQGCYTEGTTMRALTGASFFAYVAMTLEECASNCASWKYFGVEYGGECYCGNTLNPGSVIDDISMCNFLCPGNSLEYCGAGGHLELYMNAAWTSATPPSTTLVTSALSSSSTSAPVSSLGWNYQGCYKDVPDKRTLTFQEPDNAAQTIEGCITTCNGLNYAIAGLEFGVQCFCSQLLHNGVTPLPDSNCNTACGGNAGEMCGGPNFVSIYSATPPQILPLAVPQSTGLPGTWAYQGCIEDNINGQRTLPEQLNLDVNDAVNCITGCQALNYTAAGLEYANQCFCGTLEDVAASGPVPSLEKECSAVCSGNSLYLCGASALLTYYTSS